MDAPTIQAITAHGIRFKQQNFGAHLRRAGGQTQPSRATAYNADITVMMGHVTDTYCWLV